MNHSYTHEFEKEALDWFKNNQRWRYWALMFFEVINLMVKSAFYAVILVPLAIYWGLVLSKDQTPFSELGAITFGGMLPVSQLLFLLLFVCTLFLLLASSSRSKYRLILDTALRMYQESEIYFKKSYILAEGVNGK